MRAVLDNSTTLDWEEQLPALMMAYNTHVHQATKETPFFLTFCHDARMPYFDLAQPRQSLGEGYAAQAFTNAQTAFKRAAENMEEAQAIRQQYYDRQTKQRRFRPGDRVMVHFPNVPTGVNQKFYKRWRLMVIVRPVGPLNVIIKEEASTKTNLVHVNRVRHASTVEIEEQCDSAVRTYEDGQSFYFQTRGETAKQKRRIPPEERESDQNEYFFYQGGRGDEAPHDAGNAQGEMDRPDTRGAQEGTDIAEEGETEDQRSQVPSNVAEEEEQEEERRSQGQGDGDGGNASGDGV